MAEFSFWKQINMSFETDLESGALKEHSHKL